MSATILIFPTKQLALANPSTGYSIDVSPVDKRGFVVLDACVPLSLTLELINLFDKYRERDIAPVRGGVLASGREAYSFEMTQPEAAGLVLVDAYVPERLAREFASLAESRQIPASAA
jgi:hypothetical protein